MAVTEQRFAAPQRSALLRWLLPAPGCRAQADLSNDLGVKGQRIPQLDGLRGIAILLVLAAHLMNGVAPNNRGAFGVRLDTGGGLIGVQLFFVLSGLLITSILLRERDSEGRIDLPSFYRRRIRRLTPVLLVISAVYAGYVIIFNRAHLQNGIAEVLHAVTYTKNIIPITESFHGTGWLSHTWSLAVEEQFYIVWPITVVVASRFGRRAIGIVALTGAVSITLVRHIHDFDPSVLYRALRWDALLVGCAIAVFRPRVPRGAGLGGTLGIGYFAFAPYPDPAAPLHYLWATASSALVVMAAPRAKWLSSPVLVRFGLISYSLYLWHVLILRWGQPAWISLPASLVAAELSYRLIETRFLRANGRHRTVALRRELRDLIDGLSPLGDKTFSPSRYST